MIFSLAIKNILRGKVRFLCAVLGIAAAGGAVDFVFSLEATNDAQASVRAAKTVSPWKSWKIEGVKMFPGRRGEATSKKKISHSDPTNLPEADLTLEAIPVTIDLRPGGRVLQGPPARTVISPSSVSNIFGNAALVGTWPEWNADEAQVVAARSALSRFGRGEIPQLGAMIKFIGENKTLSAKLVGVLEQEKTPLGFPGVFANRTAFDGIKNRKNGEIRLWKHNVVASGVSGIDDISSQFASDAGRNLDRAGPLMLWAAAMSALCLLVNSLLLSVEATRRNISLLRVVGMTSHGVARMVAAESLMAGLAGSLLGCGLAAASLKIYVFCESSLFPEGAVFSWSVAATVALCSIALCVPAALCVLRPALSVRALEVASQDSPNSVKYRRIGMMIAFACGFGAFVAVEVWGASLMKSFIPSKEWPDAIVSLLPGGVSPYDIDKLSGLDGVERIGELQVMQAPFFPHEETKRGGRGGVSLRNALLMAGRPELMFDGKEPLLPLKIISGNRDVAIDSVKREKACIITWMMARARRLKPGDELVVQVRGEVHRLKIAAVADLNWHMVTSRGLVRGLNGMPSDTDGPVFVSFETMYNILPVPSLMSKMTHLWLRYKPAFVERHGVFGAGRRVEREITDRLGNPVECAIRLHSRDEIADGTLAHGAKLIGAMARVPFVFLIVLSLGFVAMLTGFADASRREFEILRAVGATRVQLASRMVGEAMRVAGCGMVFGFPVGALAGWLFTWATRSAMSHWGLPASFAVPFAEIGYGAAGAVVSALLVAVPVSVSLAIFKFRRRVSG